MVGHKKASLRAQPQPRALWTWALRISYFAGTRRGRFVAGGGRGGTSAGGGFHSGDILPFSSPLWHGDIFPLPFRGEQNGRA